MSDEDLKYQQRRSALVGAFCKAYTRERLNTVVLNVLGSNLDTYSIGTDLVTVVDGLFLHLEQSGELLQFLVQIERNADIKIKLAINIFLKLVDATADPCEDLVVLREPFVDRQVFRDKLRELLTTNGHHVLLARGPRYCGRSHSKWLVQHAADRFGAETIYLDLLDFEVEDLVEHLSIELGFPREFNRDGLAKRDTIARGFCAHLRSHFRTGGPDQRFCILFDHFDRDEVSLASREFVNRLVEEAADARLRNIQIIVLGFTGALNARLAYRVLEEPILPLQAADVVSYVSSFGTTAGLDPQAIQLTTTEVLEGLTFPLDCDGMNDLGLRLKSKLLLVNAL